MLEVVQWQMLVVAGIGRWVWRVVVQVVVSELWVVMEVLCSCKARGIACRRSQQCFCFCCCDWLAPGAAANGAAW